MPGSPRAARPPLSAKAKQFISSVLAHRPKLAVFDCDGTLWAGDAGEEFLFWEMDCGVVSRDIAEWVTARYRDYKQGLVDEETMCGEMVTLHRGLQEAAVEAAAKNFFAERVEPRIFVEMQELTFRLAETGCEVWTVSSTNEWVIRAGLRRFAIPANHILAASVRVQDGIISDQLIRVPTDEGKAVAIQDVIGKKVDLVFGNSMHDAAMLQAARLPYAIAPIPALQKLAKSRGWQVYIPQQLT